MRLGLALDRQHLARAIQIRDMCLRRVERDGKLRTFRSGIHEVCHIDRWQIAHWDAAMRNWVKEGYSYSHGLYVRKRTGAKLFYICWQALCAELDADCVFFWRPGDWEIELLTALYARLEEPRSEWPAALSADQARAPAERGNDA